MINSITSKYKKLLILSIILIALVLRFIGIVPGYPPYHSDEGMSYSQGINMITENTLDAHGYPLAYAYPNVVPLVNAIFFKAFFLPVSWTSFWIQDFGQVLEGLIHIPLTPVEYKKILQLHILGEREKNVLVWGRTVSAIFGVGVVYLTYLLASKLFSEKKWIGYIAAFLVAVNYRQVLNSHFDLPDIYNAFFMLLSILTSINLWRSPNRNNYIFAGIACGLSFSTKFHTYSLFPLLTAHIYISLQEKGKFLKNLIFDSSIYLSVFSFITTVLLINPYHLINLEKTLHLLSDVSGKYSAGKNKLDNYSYWYLFNIGLGKIISIFAIVGIVLSLILNFKKSFFLISCLGSFLLVMTYLTGGGFYTRNFLTIIPIALIFAAFFISVVVEKVRPRPLAVVLVIIVTIGISISNIENSLVVIKEYSKPWNVTLISNWLMKNIPIGSKVSAHSSIPIPVEKVEILPYEYNISYSLEEFRLDGAEYAVTNLDWATNAFYGWMGRDDLFIKGKPISELEDTYPAMSLREISDFVVFSEINSWQAPDSHFIVSKIPEYKVINKTKSRDYELSGIQDKNNLWKSEVINVSDWNGFVIDFDMRVNSSGRDGFVWVNFYKSEEDARLERNRVAIRLSARHKPKSTFEIGSLVGIVPDANYMVIGLGLYDPAISQIEVRKIEVYSAEVEIDLNNVKIDKIMLDDNIIFPNSHGYL